MSREPGAVTERILTAARAEFMRAGFESASTNRIVSAMRGSKSTLFRYFPTKNDLLEAVVRMIVSGWRDAVHSESIGDNEPGSWLVAFGTLTLEWLLSEEPLFVGRLVIVEGNRFPRLRSIWLENAAEPIHSAIVERLRYWHRVGLIASQDPDQDAECYSNLVFSGVVSNCYYGAPALSRSELSGHVASAVSFFMRAIGATPVPPAAR